MPWLYVDPNTGQVQTCGNTDTRRTRDFTWMGIRKGGRRWYRPFASDAAIFLEGHNPDTPGFDYRITLTPDPTKASPVVRGITNDKKRIYAVMQSNSATNPDWFQVHDFEGNLIRSVTFSDGVIRHNEQPCFMGHNLFVISNEGGGFYFLKRYALDGFLVEKAALPIVGGLAVTYHGITTDGHDFYLIWYGTIAAPPPTVITQVIKVTGTSPYRQIRFYAVPGGTYYDYGITFMGRYLLTQLQIGAATPPTLPP